jgi:hypothetical protein
MSRRRTATVGLVWALLLGTATSAQVPSPTLEGPVSGGNGSPFIAATLFDLALVNYTQEEFFISGTATAYANDGVFDSDGRWSIVPSTSAAYKTRILVYRPLNAKKFNGTVIVEWLNVSGGLDSAPDWLNMHAELIRRGFAWVGVSAQYVGVEGGPSIVGLPGMPLKKTDEARYGSLVHPGDSFSYDMFSQAGQALLHPAGANPLGPLQPRRLIAAGESQSAFRLVTYINAIHRRDRIYDGFFVHSRSASGANLADLPQPVVRVPSPARIRTDLDEPVLTFQTETDLVFLGSFHDRQPDSDRFRLWEVAGTAHADAYTLVTAFNDLGRSPAAADLVVTADPIPGLISCGAPINSGPQHFVLKAAIVALDRWIKDGTPAPSAPRLEVAAGSPPVIARDEHGNALGGIRTPQVDVPIAKLAGDGQAGSILCLLFGTTTPFDDAKLAALYPTHDAYLSAFSAATRRAVAAGFIGSRDARLMRQSAALSDVGR